MSDRRRKKEVLRPPRMPTVSSARRRWWFSTPIFVAVCLILFTTADERQVAGVADGRQMIFTAVALTESGTLGQARGRDLAVERSGGDSVSRFGLGMAFAQVPAAL